MAPKNPIQIRPLTPIIRPTNVNPGVVPPGTRIAPPPQPTRGLPPPGIAPPPQPTRAPPPFDPTTESEPIHLSAQVVLQPGATQSPNAIALTNPNGAPMEIYEISFTLVAGTTSTRVTGAAVGVKLDLGNFPITKDFTPINLLGPARNFLAEIGAASPAGVNSLLNFSGPYENYVWRLPVPIHVPAGAVLFPQIQHRNLTTDAITVTVGYSGRSLAMGARPPKRVRLPYVASWVSKGFDTFGAADTDQSTETDLVNMLTQPLKVLQLIGRPNSVYFLGNQVSGMTPGEFASLLLSVRLADSLGHGLVPQPTLFSQVFTPGTAVFPAEFSLPPGGHLRAFLAKAAPAVSQPGKYSSQAMIAMIGWREVEG